MYKCNYIANNIIVLTAKLFCLQIHAFFRSHIEEKHATSDEKERRRVTLHYNDLRQKADTLKIQLSQVYTW
jgi:hypothetical protein